VVAQRYMYAHDNMAGELTYLSLTRLVLHILLTHTRALLMVATIETYPTSTPCASTRSTPLVPETDSSIRMQTARGAY
jgi:hypothetical protein